MGNEVIYLDTFQALHDYRIMGPLSDLEYNYMLEMIPRCPLEGEKFDAKNMLYPCKIPKKPSITCISDEREVYAVGVQYNKAKFVKVMGNLSLVAAYENNLDQFLFVVGQIQEIQKEEKVYYNLNPRGWVIVNTGIQQADPVKKKNAKKTQKNQEVESD
jgi:hypothetical protein